MLRESLLIAAALVVLSAPVSLTEKPIIASQSISADRNNADQNGPDRFIRPQTSQQTEPVESPDFRRNKAERRRS